MSVFEHPSRPVLLAALALALACSGEAFDAASDAAGGGGATVSSGSTGGTAPGVGGVTSSDGAPSTGGAAGLGAAAGAGGALPSLEPCGPLAGKAPRLYTTLDGSKAILQPSSGVGPGAGNGTFTTGKCAAALDVKDAGHYLSYPALGNVSTTVGTLDFWMLPGHSPKDGKVHTFLFVAGRFSVAKGDTGNLTVGVGDAAGGVQVTHVKSDELPYVAGAWVRVTITWDFGRADQHVRVYFDQVEVAKYLDASSGSQKMEPVDGDDTLVIGARSNNSVEVAGAVLDEVKIYDTVMFP